MLRFRFNRNTGTSAEPNRNTGTHELLLVGSALALLAWLAVLVAPHQPHRVRERLEADSARRPTISSSVTVLIPARDEAALIGRTIAALGAQGRGLEVVVVDDQSSDDTREVAARACGEPSLPLRVDRRPAAARRLGRQALGARARLGRRRPAVRAAARRRHRARAAARAGAAREAARARRDARVADGRASLRDVLGAAADARRSCSSSSCCIRSRWSNDATKATAAAAGGCMLVRTDALREIGGFAAIRGALIDDCTLAAALKRHRPPIWLGMTHSVRSLRVYASLARLLEHGRPQRVHAAALFDVVAAAGDGAHGRHAARAGRRRRRGGGRGGAALGAGGRRALGSRWPPSYWPVVSFYRLPAAWALTLPVAAALFLAMTWSSAIGYWRGTRASWKARDYGRAQASPSR